MASAQCSGTIIAEPSPITVEWRSAALLIIDMQRDFLEPGGFGETLGNDVSQLEKAVGPTAAVLKAARKANMLVIHTREGHLPDLSDAPPAKIERGEPSLRIGDPGPMGRILIRGKFPLASTISWKPWTMWKAPKRRATLTRRRAC